MSLRLLEVMLPPGRVSDLTDVLEELEVVDVWTVEEAPNRGVVRALVLADRAEEVTDCLRDRLEWNDDFRLVLLKVEATLPNHEDEEREDPRRKERRPNRVSREELYEDLSAGSRISVVYLVTVALSTVVAAVGLLRGDVAVIIGAMVIAPLLAPNVALSLAATLGDGSLARRASVSAVGGALVALAVSGALGAILLVDPTIPEIASRSRVDLGDPALALAAGSAGALAYTTGLPAAVIGVMVAVALLPPLVTFGLLLGAGYWEASMGAGLLVVTNITCINLAGVGTFLAQRVQPRTWWEEERARKASRVALVTWIVLLAILVVLILQVIGEPPPAEAMTR